MEILNLNIIQIVAIQAACKALTKKNVSAHFCCIKLADWQSK